MPVDSILFMRICFCFLRPFPFFRHPNVFIFCTSNLANRLDSALVDRADFVESIELPTEYSIYSILRECIVELQRVCHIIFFYLERGLHLVLLWVMKSLRDCSLYLLLFKHDILMIILESNVWDSGKCYWSYSTTFADVVRVARTETRDSR